MAHADHLENYDGTLEDFVDELMELSSEKKAEFFNNLSDYVHVDAQKDSKNYPVMGKKLTDISELLFKISELYSSLDVEGKEEIENYQDTNSTLVQELGHTKYDFLKEVFTQYANLMDAEYERFPAESEDTVYMIERAITYIVKDFGEICRLPKYKEKMSNE